MPTASSPAPTGQAPEGSDPQVGDAQTPQDGEHEGSSGITDPVALQRELAKVRQEAAAARVELKAFRDAEKQKADAEATEVERLTKRQKELEAEVERLTKQARQKAIEASIAKQAVALGVIDPDAAVRLLDTDELEVDEETGEPKNVEAALRALIKAKPYLASKAPENPAPGRTNGGAGATEAPPPNLSADELAAATEAGMTPERYAALKNVKTFDDWKKLQPATTK